MRLEAITPFTYRWPGGEVHLEPGRPIDLPDERAQRLLNKAPGKVRVVESANGIDGDRLGHLVTWDSPLFGLLSATVQEDLPHGLAVRVS